jgi:cyanuric acid amidohydrolase
MHVCPMRSPSDASAVEELFASSGVRPESVVALVGKTEGSGLHDDFSRELAHLRLSEVLAQHLGIRPAEIEDRVTFVLSGGCYGVIAPHVTVLTLRWIEVEPGALPSERRLVLGRAHSEAILPEEVGRMGQVCKVAAAVRHAMRESGIADPSDVHSVMVKAPSLSWATIHDAESRSATVVTHDLSAGESGAICYSNDASALGVALALGEVPEAALRDDIIRRDWSLYSAVAATSSGGEKRRAEVLLLGNRQGSASDLRIGHAVIRDPIDAEGVKDALRSAGLDFACCPSAEDRRRIVQVFAKLIVPGSDQLRGRRITLLDDPEAHRSAKAVGGTLVASITGDPAIFLSGGEKNSHQGPPGGSPIAAVVRVAGPDHVSQAPTSRAQVHRDTPDVASASAQGYP